MTTTSIRAAQTLATKNPVLESWGIVIECDSEEEALLLNYAYRYNKYGSVIELRPDGKFNLSIFNKEAKGLGFI